MIVVTRDSGIVIGTRDHSGEFQWITFCDQVLDNPSGVLAEPGGTLLVAQRHELTRLHDTDSDGLADYFEAVATTDAPITAGTQPDGDGNWLLALAVGQGRARWQGWVTRVAPDGTVSPLCAGVHRSGGIATNRDGIFFATDSSSDWSPEHALRSSLQESLFHGHPAALLWDSSFSSEHPDPLAWAKNNPEDLATRTSAAALRIPAGEFCAAPGDLAFHLGGDDTFGPFSGQCFIADSGASGGRLLRAMPELVEGIWQGSVVHFNVKGLSGANAHRLCFSPDGSQLFVGQRRGSNAPGAAPRLQCITALAGTKSFALSKLGTLPAGLQLSFTDEVDRALAVDLKTYAIHRHPSDGGERETAAPERAIITPNGRTITLFFDAVTLAPGFRYAVDLSRLRSASGARITTPLAHHTVHRIPADLTPTIPHPKPRSEDRDEDKDDEPEKDRSETGPDTGQGDSPPESGKKEQ